LSSASSTVAGFAKTLGSIRFLRSPEIMTPLVLCRSDNKAKFV
jgi:hypothetical protein